jgi:hypothetical protein
MTTFTLQDLTPAQQEAVKQHEAMHAAHQVLNTRSINNLPTTPEEDEAMQALTEKQFVEYGMNNPISASAIEYATQHAPEPQPSQVSPEAVIDEMLYTIKQSLLLLTTVINQSKAQPEVGTNVPSLQETIELTLQQADWFKDMVKDEVENRVESEVEMYFERRFDPTDHFDFGDAISNEVNDRIDDVVRDQLDDVVADKLDEVVTEKLENASVSISF